MDLTIGCTPAVPSGICFEPGPVNSSELKHCHDKLGWIEDFGGDDAVVLANSSAFTVPTSFPRACSLLDGIFDVRALGPYMWNSSFELVLLVSVGPSPLPDASGAGNWPAFMLHAVPGSVVSIYC